MPQTIRLKFTEDEQSKMDEHSAKKAELEEKRRVLVQQLEEVDTKITEVQADYGAIYNNRNPVLRLPVEVTCLIFALAQRPRNSGDGEYEDEYEDKGSEDESEEDEDDDEDDEEDIVLMEVVVSQVCRQWRSIALGFPSLWTTFYFEADPALTVPLQRFDSYMERSAALPLRIWLDFRLDIHDYDNLRLVMKAVDHVHRWQHFTLYSSDDAVMQPLSGLRDLSAPMLEYLTIAPGVQLDIEDDNLVGDTLNPLTNMDPRIFTGGAPNLTYLMLDEYSMRHALPPLSNLTILRIEKQNCDSIPAVERKTFLDLLSLPSLAQLSLSGDLIEPFGTPRSIQMPNLKRFRVNEFDAIWDLLPGIRAPQLDTLIIHMCQYAAGFVPAASPPSPDRGYTFPALRKLYVIDSDVHFTVVEKFTQLTSQATDVLISHESLQANLLQRIVIGLFSAVVWPRLKTLSCCIAGVEDIDTFSTFAQSRSKDSFAFRLPPVMFEGWDEGLEALKAVSSVVLDNEGWELNEPFWPQDVHIGSHYDFGKDDGFSMGTYFGVCLSSGHSL